MRLVWKLLRQHLSVLQLVGFFLANLFGMLVVLLSVQFYSDVRPVFAQEDGFIKNDYLIVNKRFSTLTGTATFTRAEIDDIRQQTFARNVGPFTATQYKVGAAFALPGMSSAMGTEMFFESVPDEFIDTKTPGWHFDSLSTEVPIILPRTYLALWNFGFAQSHSLPKLTESTISNLRMDIIMRSKDGAKLRRLTGVVKGFTTRLNTILAPESFVTWSNHEFAPSEDTSPTQLIVEVANPADDHIMKYFTAKGYEIAEDKLDAGKTMYFLRIVCGIVMSVGLLISVLSFYILMLSIYLLVQKNTIKLQNLLLIGYSPERVSLPYQLLTVGMNLGVLVLALVLLLVARSQYLELIWNVFPQLAEAPVWPALVLGGVLFVVVNIINIVAVRRKVLGIWNATGLAM